MDNTIEYYNKNAEQFVRGTLLVDFTVTQERFLSKLSVGACILDFGCGSGRDAKYFLDKGYQVEATDGSAELCKMASKYTGIRVKQMLFEELGEKEKYDGIWACSSILHLDKKALKDVLKKMAILGWIQYEKVKWLQSNNPEVPSCYRDNLHSLWAGQELYRKGNSETEFMNILQKNMQPVYDSARRQGYEVWNRG